MMTNAEVVRNGTKVHFIRIAMSPDYSLPRSVSNKKLAIPPLDIFGSSPLPTTIPAASDF